MIEMPLKAPHADAVRHFAEWAEQHPEKASELIAEAMNSSIDFDDIQEAMNCRTNGCKDVYAAFGARVAGAIRGLATFHRNEIEQQIESNRR
jgi:hypothetical protein